MCRIFNGVMCGWRKNPSVLDGKIDEGTIFVFFYSTSTILKKKKKIKYKTEWTKNKDRKPNGV